MFGKPFRVKSNSSIKGSDRKKLRAQIEKLYPSISGDELKEMVPNKEEMTIMKIYTHSGTNCMVYCLGQNPIFFDLDGTVFPTVYTLWKFPDLIPVLTTWPQVFTKISAGADLMLPGVIVKGDITPSNLGNLQKNQPCGVKLLGNRAPVAVGRTGLSSEEMYESAMRGKGVIILHSYQDHLWAHGDKTDPPLIEDTEMIEYMSLKKNSEFAEEEEEELEEGEALSEAATGEESLQDQESKIAESLDDMRIEDDNTGASASVVEGATGGICDDEASETMVEVETDQERQERMDSMLYQCLLHSLKTTIKPKTDLPMLTSKFFKAHIQVCCPPGESIDIKKSSYKKLSKFLGAMSKQGLLKVKELSKGCESVIEIDKDHPEVRGFVVPQISNDASPKEEFPTSGNVTMVDMFMVSAATSPLFKPAGIEKGRALTGPDIRQFIKDYVAENDLKDANRPSQVILDPILSDIVLARDEYLETLKWDVLIDRVCKKMNPAYQITLPGQKPVVKKGKPEPVVINVAQRGGNKKVTLVHNLETFGVDPQDFAHDVQVGMACSTSVSQMPGKNKGMEVLIQGNQINFVANLLADKYGVHRKHMQGLEKAPKSGKKKR